MTRTWRIALSSLALGVAAAGGAGAAQATPVFEAGAYPATVQGQVATMVIGTEAGQIKCQSTSFDGTLAAASSTLTLQPLVSGCMAFNFAVAINNQGCAYRLHATERQSADQYKGHVSNVCPGPGGIIWGTFTCTLEIPPQEGLTSVDLDDDTGSPDRVTAAFEVSELAYTVTKDGLGCPFAGTGPRTDGTITSSAFVLKAVNASKTSEEYGFAVSGE